MDKEAFEELKNRVANAIALNTPDFNKQFVLVTNASDQEVGAMLAKPLISRETYKACCILSPSG